MAFHSLTALVICLIVSYVNSASVIVKVETLKELTDELNSTATKIYANVSQQEELTYPEISGFPLLEEFRIEHGGLKKFQAGMFKNFAFLTYLSLFGNSIQVIPPHSFPSSLTQLDLGKNYIEVIKREMFDGLGNLTLLRLNRNSIHFIAPGAFNDAINLRTLELFGNKLEIFPNDMQLPELTKLDANENQITTIKKRMFDGLPKLESLILNSNKIQALPQELEQLFKRLTSSVSLGDNPIHCNCLTAWIVKDRTLQRKFGRFKCATPRRDSMGKPQMHECKAPAIISPARDIQPEMGEVLTLTCTAVGDPAPNITIYIDGVIVTHIPPPQGLTNEETTGNHEIVAESNATILCLAENIQGSANTTRKMTVYNPPPANQDDSVMIGVGAGVGGAVIVAIAIGLVVYLVKRNKRRDQIVPLVEEERQEKNIDRQS